MDPSVIRALSEMIGPVIVLLIFGAVPTSIVFMKQHFKLKSRELELDAEMHGREMESRLRAMEARQGAIESALTGIASSLSISQGQRALMEPPPAESAPETQAVRRISEK